MSRRGWAWLLAGAIAAGCGGEEFTAAEPDLDEDAAAGAAGLAGKAGSDAAVPDVSDHDTASGGTSGGDAGGASNTGGASGTAGQGGQGGENTGGQTGEGGQGGASGVGGQGGIGGEGGAGIGGQAGADAGVGGSAGADASAGGSAGTTGSGGYAGVDASAGGTAGTSGMGGTGVGGLGWGGASGAGGKGGSGGFGGFSGKGGSGGVAGFGGFSGKGGAAGWAGVGECQLDATCTEYSDCCTCVSLPKIGGAAPSCTVNNCTQTVCEVADHKGPACVLQHCSMQIDCDISKVVCDVAQQPCPAGTVHSVHGVCWGPCVEPSQCDHVESCDRCDPAYYVCVAHTDLGVFGYHCEKIPAACAVNKTCGCMKDYFCGSTEVCEDIADGKILCTCEGCV